jgi:hypothetical protein
MTPEEIDHQKSVEYYAASVNAWFNTALEHDKSLLTLAAGGIGLLITLLTTVGITSAAFVLLYISAIASFLVTVIAVLVVFRRNRTYIEKLLTGGAVVNDPVLSKADATALWAFGLGVLFSTIIGIVSAINSYTTQEKSMTNESTKSSQSVPLNGASNLQPGTDFTKSFNGAGNLAPQASTNTSNTTASTPASPSSSVPAASTSTQSPSGSAK